MVENEGQFKRYLFESKTASPELLLPQRLVSDPTNLEIASDLAGFPAPLDAVESEEKKPYVYLTIEDVRALYSELSTVQEHKEPVSHSKEELSERLSVLGLMNASEIDLEEFASEYERAPSRLQRESIYERLAKAFDKSGEEDTVVFYTDLQEGEMLAVPRKTIGRILESMYKDELSHGLTKHEIDRKNAERVINASPNDVIAAAEEHLRNSEFTGENMICIVEELIKIAAEAAERRKQRTDKDVEVVEITKTEATIKKEKTQKQAENEQQRIAARTDLEIIKESLEKHHRNVRQGLVWVHESEDEPSEEAAQWVRELWNRPF